MSSKNNLKKRKDAHKYDLEREKALQKAKQEKQEKKAAIEKAKAAAARSKAKGKRGFPMSRVTRKIAKKSRKSKAYERRLQTAVAMAMDLS